MGLTSPHAAGIGHSRLLPPPPAVSVVLGVVWSADSADVGATGVSLVESSDLLPPAHTPSPAAPWSAWPPAASGAGRITPSALASLAASGGGRFMLAALVSVRLDRSSSADPPPNCSPATPSDGGGRGEGEGRTIGPTFRGVPRAYETVTEMGSVARPTGRLSREKSTR